MVVPGGGPRTALVEQHPPQKLVKLLDLNLSDAGGGKDELLKVVDKILKYSVNTWDQGFLDKLYASTNAVGVVAELILAVLNTNLHVYQVSPALTVVEKTVTQRLAKMFGFSGTHAGGVSTQGGSGSNLTALIIARNTLYPDSKVNGNGIHKFDLFTSVHGHYSLEKAAQMIGLGSSAVITVPVDEKGAMITEALERLINKSKESGRTPLFINATAGTTVLGSYDPFTEISAISRRHNLWMHIDGAWGGPVVFSPTHRHKLDGCHLADSLALNPHKMLNAPVTCSILLGQDLRQFHRANTLPAGYLFHSNEDDADQEVWDLADLTPQCGRRGDSFKLALSWIYHGASGFAQQIDHGFEIASYFASKVSQHKDLVLVSQNPPPLFQVCFYYAPNGRVSEVPEENTKVTANIVQRLITKGFMVDYAPGELGSFFRVVVNVQTRKGTVDGLMKAILETAVEKDPRA